MSNRTKSVARWSLFRQGFLVLAAFALSVLLVQPVCDAHEMSAGDPAACCALVTDASPTGFVNATPPTAKPSVLVAEVLPAAWRAAARDAAIAAPPYHPPASLPYHARSARILS